MRGEQQKEYKKYKMSWKNEVKDLQSQLSKIKKDINPTFNSSKIGISQLSNIGGFSKRGLERANEVKKMVIATRLNLYSYYKWPFKDQSPEELELYLYKYGCVMIFKIEKLNYFIPVIFSISNNIAVGTSPIYVSAVNIDNISVLPISIYASEKIKSALNFEEKKKNLPFIFDNAAQFSPEENQHALFDNLSGSYNANVSNRINKTLAKIIETNDTTHYFLKLKNAFESEDYSPVLIVNKNKVEIKTKNKEELFPQNTTITETVSTDLYISNSKEAKDLKTEIFKVNGIMASIENNKTSAQETDSQTFSGDRETANNMLNMLSSRKKWIKHIRKEFNFQGFDVDINKRYRDFYKKAMENNNDKEDKDNTNNKEIEKKDELNKNVTNEKGDIKNV